LVEPIILSTTCDEILKFNLFSATLGYSRFYYFEYTEFKQKADFKRWIIHFLKKIGRLINEVLTDNMSAIANVSDDDNFK